MTGASLHAALLTLCDRFEAERDYLSELDGAVGDGDHGVNMAKCFRMVRSKLPPADTHPGPLLAGVATVVMNAVGGATGALYGVMFARMGAAAGAAERIGCTELVAMFEGARAAVQELGKAQVGDKTLLDTLAPAQSALAQAVARGDSLPAAAAAMVAAAAGGMQSTADLVAKVGRASRLGERSRGKLDAGAVSCLYIVEAIAAACHG